MHVPETGEKHLAGAVDPTSIAGNRDVLSPDRDDLISAHDDGRVRLYGSSFRVEQRYIRYRDGRRGALWKRCCDSSSALVGARVLDAGDRWECRLSTAGYVCEPALSL